MDFEESKRLARLLRGTQDPKVRDELLKQIEWARQCVSDEQSAMASEIPKAFAIPRSNGRSRRDLDVLKLRLRHLVQGGANWVMLEPVVMEVCRVSDEVGDIAAMTELAAIEDAASAVSVLKCVDSKISREAWLLLHVDVRRRLLEYASRQVHCQNWFAWILVLIPRQSKMLQDFEWRFLIEALRTQPAALAQIYLENRQVISGAIAAHLGGASLAVQLAGALERQGLDEEAARVLEEAQLRGQLGQDGLELLSEIRFAHRLLEDNSVGRYLEFEGWEKLLKVEEKAAGDQLSLRRDKDLRRTDQSELQGSHTTAVGFLTRNAGLSRETMMRLSRHYHREGFMDKALEVLLHATSHSGLTNRDLDAYSQLVTALGDPEGISGVAIVRFTRRDFGDDSGSPEGSTIQLGLRYKVSAAAAENWMRDWFKGQDERELRKVVTPCHVPIDRGDGSEELLALPIGMSAYRRSEFVDATISVWNRLEENSFIKSEVTGDARLALAAAMASLQVELRENSLHEMNLCGAPFRVLRILETWILSGVRLVSINP